MLHYPAPPPPSLRVVLCSKYVLCLHMSAHACASIRHSFVAKRLFTPHGPRAMESKELVPAVLFFRYRDFKKGFAKKEAWNAPQKTTSRLTTYPLPGRKQLIDEAKRKADSQVFTTKPQHQKEKNLL